MTGDLAIPYALFQVFPLVFYPAAQGPRPSVMAIDTGNQIPFPHTTAKKQARRRATTSAVDTVSVPRDYQPVSQPIHDRSITFRGAPLAAAPTLASPFC